MNNRPIRAQLIGTRTSNLFSITTESGSYTDSQHHTVTKQRTPTLRCTIRLHGIYCMRSKESNNNTNMHNIRQNITLLSMILLIYVQICEIFEASGYTIIKIVHIRANKPYTYTYFFFLNTTKCKVSMRSITLICISKTSV